MNREADTQRYYREYYGKKGADRNDFRRNRGVLFQGLAAEASIVRAAYAIDHDTREATVLEVGCGDGSSIFHLLRLGYRPEKITGIDILSELIAQARRLYPQIHFIQGDASRMEVADDTFDLVFESTMFATLADDALRAAIAREMVRVCKPGGYLLLIDWRTPKPRDLRYKALTKRRLAALFSVGTHTHIVTRCRGALIPPLGRFLSKWLPCAYFPIAAAFPFLVGQVACVLQKKPSRQHADADCRPARPPQEHHFP